MLRRSLSYVFLVVFLWNCSGIGWQKHQELKKAFPEDDINAATIAELPVFKTDSVQILLRLYDTGAAQQTSISGECILKNQYLGLLDGMLFNADYFVWIEKMHRDRYRVLRSYPLDKDRLHELGPIDHYIILKEVVPVDVLLPRFGRKGKYRVKIICGVYKVIRAGFPMDVRLLGKIESNYVEFQIE